MRPSLKMGENDKEKELLLFKKETKSSQGSGSQYSLAQSIKCSVK
jgi:hypothetical protein